ncbi:MAG: hypothetical protein ABF328_02515, partial [Akkermansiaceae bacterium]
MSGARSLKRQGLVHLVLCLVFSGICFGDPATKAHQGLAGANQQYEKRWKGVQERFKNDAEFMTLLRREKKRREHFLNFHPFDPNNAASIDKRAILMRDNSKWLNGMLVNPATPTDQDGVYWDGMGNSLRIKKIKGRHYFAIRKYESSHGHQGQVAGLLGVWKNGRSLFTGKFGSEQAAGTIQFELRNGLLAVTTSGSIRSIGGPRASFTSTYSRVSALKEKDHRLIKEGL